MTAPTISGDVPDIRDDVERGPWVTREIRLLLSWELVGAGTEGDPKRRVATLWTHDGREVVRFDPCASEDAR